MANAVENDKAMSASEKKAVAQQKVNYDLHVLLLMKQTNAPKAKAQFEAYREGPAGLQQRLAGKVGG